MNNHKVKQRRPCWTCKRDVDPNGVIRLFTRVECPYCTRNSDAGSPCYALQCGHVACRTCLRHWQNARPADALDMAFNVDGDENMLGNDNRNDPDRFVVADANGLMVNANGLRVQSPLNEPRVAGCTPVGGLRTQLGTDVVGLATHGLHCCSGRHSCCGTCHGAPLIAYPGVIYVTTSGGFVNFTIPFCGRRRPRNTRCT
eukprot:GEMP01067289.1.p1 GENE.GEMP01067289.1~~GEMP01067289.1.p1  ORF type:complete len:200 (+),score=32.57 GEMP01067289.1:237-836(+)